MNVANYANCLVSPGRWGRVNLLGNVGKMGNQLSENSEISEWLIADAVRRMETISKSVDEGQR